MCKIIQIRGGHLRDNTPGVIGFEYKGGTWKCYEDFDTYFLHGQRVWALPTATSFELDAIWMTKENKSPVTLQLNVGVKQCARLLFIRDEMKHLASENLNSLQTFCFVFPYATPDFDFKIKMVGDLLRPVP